MEALYRRLFPGENKDGYPRFYEAIAARLGPSGRVLDLGCGDHTRLACFRCGAREVWGADFQEHSSLEHRQWFRRLGRRGEVPFPDQWFDVVASCWVLEHVQRPRQFLTEIARVLRPGGAFVSLTVNAAHYMTWAARLLQRFPHPLTQWLVARLYGRPEYDTFPTFYRLNTLAQVRAHGAKAGLRLDEVVQIANPDYFRFSRLTWSAAVLADWLLERLQPGLGRIYWVIAMIPPRRAPSRAQAA